MERFPNPTILSRPGVSIGIFLLIQRVKET
jgi:hypothetical protein